MDLVEKDSELYPILSLFLVQVTGFPPVAALADEQLLTVRSFGQNATHFSPYFKSHTFIKQNDRAARTLPFHLVHQRGECTNLILFSQATCIKTSARHGANRLTFDEKYGIISLPTNLLLFVKSFLKKYK